MADSGRQGMDKLVGVAHRDGNSAAAFCARMTSTLTRTVACAIGHEWVRGGTGRLINSISAAPSWSSP